jgi:uncharacterized membrane protein
MTLESGRKLGLISSLLFVILPIASIAVFAGFFLALISAIQTRTVTGAFPSGAFALMSFGVSILAISVLSVIGLILFILAMYYLSRYYSEPAIFKNIVFAIIIAIVTGVIVTAAYVALLIPVSRTVTQAGVTPSPTQFFGSFLIGIIIILFVTVVMGIISSILIMRAFNKLGEKSGVDSFKTAGLLYLLGVLLSIVGIGAILSWIAFIFAAIGFYRLKPTAAAPALTYPTETPHMALQTKRCPYCSTEHTLDAAYCRSCGKPLQ